MKYFYKFTFKTSIEYAFIGNSKQVLFTKLDLVFVEYQLHDFVENHNLWTLFKKATLCARVK